MKGKIGYVIPNDTPVPTGDTDGAATIANWLGADIQYSLDTLAEWVNVFDDVANGRRKAGYQGTGNTHSVMAVGEKVFIECEYIESHKVFLTREQVKCALDEYMKFLKSDRRYGREMPKPFDVEYEAEGAEALECYLQTGGSLGA